MIHGLTLFLYFFIIIMATSFHIVLNDLDKYKYVQKLAKSYLLRFLLFSMFCTVTSLLYFGTFKDFKESNKAGQIVPKENQAGSIIYNPSNTDDVTSKKALNDTEELRDKTINEFLEFTKKE